MNNLKDRVVDVLAKQSVRGLPVMICRNDKFMMLPDEVPQVILYEEVYFWRIYGNKVFIELNKEANYNV